MNYHEMKAAMAHYNAVRLTMVANRCCGCGVDFIEYGMTYDDAYVESGRHYCNSGCCDDRAVKQSERDDLDSF